MARDWDKLRRQDKARKPVPYNKVAAKAAWYEARSKSRRKQRLFSHRARPVYQPPKPLTPPAKAAVRWLVIQIGATTATAVFTRPARSNSWRCTGSDHPAISWFTGVIHMQTIESWLRGYHYPFRWVSSNPTAPVRTETQPRTAEFPAEAYTPSQASEAKAVNTEPALQNNTHPSTPPDASFLTGALAQTGVTTSLLLNSSRLTTLPGGPPRSQSQA